MLNFIRKKKYTYKKIYILILIVSLIIGAKSFYDICYKNHYLTIVAPINYRDGMGRQAIDLINVLDNADVDLNLVYNIKITPPDSIKKYLYNKNKKPGYIVLNEHSLLQTNISLEEYKNDWLLNNKYKYRNKFNNIKRDEQIYINYSMFEADMLPEDAVYNFNKYWDMIVVPDQNLVDIYRQSGINIPIFVLPLGVNVEEQLEAPLKTTKNEIFKFANFSIFEERKNLLKLVQAFHQAFKDNDQVRLLISSRGKRGTAFEEVIDYILKNNVSGVEIDKLGPKDDDYLNFLFSRIDCYVSPSKGEGFSFIPREAMARGIPVIVSDAIAQKTIADTGLVKVVHSNKLVPGDYIFINRIISNFIDIEVSDLADAMLEIYNNYQTYLDKAPEARAWAEKGQYKYLKEEYINMVKPRKIILGDRNEITKDYLMTDSQKLYNQWKHLEEIGVLK